MKIPTIAEVGVTPADFERIIAISDNKNNPTALSVEEMHEALEIASQKF
jgi:hypothetical protein